MQIFLSSARLDTERRFYAELSCFLVRKEKLFASGTGKYLLTYDWKCWMFHVKMCNEILLTFRDNATVVDAWTMSLTLANDLTFRNSRSWISTFEQCLINWIQAWHFLGASLKVVRRFGERRFTFLFGNLYANFVYCGKHFTSRTIQLCSRDKRNLFFLELIKLHQQR